MQISAISTYISYLGVVNNGDKYFQSQDYDNALKEYEKVSQFLFSDVKDKIGCTYLNQAKNIADSNDCQRAIEIIKKIPDGTLCYSEAQKYKTNWNIFNEVQKTNDFQKAYLELEKLKSKITKYEYKNLLTKLYFLENKYKGDSQSNKNDISQDDRTFSELLKQDMKIEMVKISAGNFIMGSKGDEGEINESPMHKVYLDDYYISKYEVAQAQYKIFMDDTGHRMPQELVIGDWDPLNKADLPVTGVTWSDANAFCEWAGGRLPTEAEWEKAARGKDGRKYPWGNDPPTCILLNFSDGHPCVNTPILNILTSLAVVGSYQSGISPYGVYDMAGNVSEWCNDWYGGKYYSGSPANNPQGPASGTERILRGGSWFSEAYYVRCAVRQHAHSTSYAPFIGFRVAYDKKKSKNVISNVPSSNAKSDIITDAPADIVKQQYDAIGNKNFEEAMNCWCRKLRKSTDKIKKGYENTEYNKISNMETNKLSEDKVKVRFSLEFKDYGSAAKVVNRAYTVIKEDGQWKICGKAEY